MYIKQLSIFVENTEGRMAEITGIIGEAGIDIRALSLADTSDFGILRLIVDKPEEAARKLKEAGLTVSVTEVIGIGIDDKPGSFAAALNVLSKVGVNVEYMYAFVSREIGRADVILRVEDNEKALTALKCAGIYILNAATLYDM